MLLYFAIGTGDASIDKISECNYRQCRSYHRAPSFQLASYIDSHVTTKFGIFVITFKVSAAGIHVPFIVVVKVVLSFVIGHDITSYVCCCFLCGRRQNTTGSPVDE